MAAASSLAAGFATFGAVALTGPGRGLLAMMLPSQGEGPVVDPANPGFYIIEFTGETADGEEVHTRLEGDGDPGYGSTSKMLAESAACLALDRDKIKVKGGFWTPASAMGAPLLKRLQERGGLSFTELF
jgi:saccharopine dehydrogenase (NAD+, L-glutamate forming)